MDWRQHKMAGNFKHIATTVLSSNGSSTIVISNIPKTYQDLKIYMSCRDYNSGNGTGTDVNMTNLNSGGTLTAGQSMYGYSNTIGADTGASRVGGIVLSANEANNFGATNSELLNYSSSISDKIHFSSIGIAATGYLVNVICNGVYNSTSEVTTFTLTAGVGNFSAGTTVALYGITRQ
jgi:hypothetical protein